MKLLLDTHALLWWLDGRALSPIVEAAIADRQNVIYVSAASAWEVSIKKASGKLRAPDDLAAILGPLGFLELAITLEDGLAAGALPGHHSDPFDRMLVAQAQRLGLTIVTADEALGQYDVPVLAAAL